MVHDDLEGWDRGRGRVRREGMYVYIQLIHFTVQQKPTQHCETITLQFKKMHHLNITEKRVIQQMILRRSSQRKRKTPMISKARIQTSIPEIPWPGY